MSHKELLNDPKSCVDEAIDGFVMSQPHLRRVAGLNIAVRRDIEEVKNHQVTLLSGGGAGHEPAHAGYVGAGMLSGAVIGNVFASPSVQSILIAIRVCCGSRGTVLIVKNYTGDRLNFGIALERAKQEGFDVEMVVVDDDVALSRGKGITGGRGVAGTILVHKLAGALAQAGSSVTEIRDKLKIYVANMATMGIALSVCTVPGTHRSTRLDGSNTVEIGMGIHGEPGREQRELPNFNRVEELTDVMVQAILGIPAVDTASRVEFSAGDPVAIMVNNLGTLSVLELQVVCKNVVTTLRSNGLDVTRLYFGTFMSSLDMRGVSLTVLKVDSEALDLLDASTSACAWVPGLPLCKNYSEEQVVPYYPKERVEDSEIKGDLSPIGQEIVSITRCVCQELLLVAEELTEFDSVAGDGDCGIVVTAGCKALLSELDSRSAVIASLNAVTYCEFLADTVSGSMGGTSGVLLEIMFRSMGNHIRHAGGSTADWPSALHAGVESIQAYGGASLGMRTLLDALIPATDALVAGAGISLAAAEALQGCERTKQLAGLAGRANYVNPNLLMGTPDAGAFGVAAAFTAIEKYFS